jgi:hypothetical protein
VSACRGGGFRSRGRSGILAQEGARQPPHLAVEARAAVRSVRVHRGVLQPPTPAPDPRDALANRLRTATTLSAGRLRSIARPTTINTNNTNTEVSRKPGQVHAGSRRQADARGRLRKSEPDVGWPGSDCCFCVAACGPAGPGLPVLASPPSARGATICLPGRSSSSWCRDSSADTLVTNG